MKTAYIGGTFDILHTGHIELFEKTKQVFDRLVVSVNSDLFTERFKRKPINPLEHRMRMLGALKCVDRVVENFGNENTGVTIDFLCKNNEPIDVIVHGNDWMGDDYMKQLGITQEWLDERGIVICYFDRDERSTTAVIERCKTV